MTIRIKFLGVIYPIDVSIYDNNNLIYSKQTSRGYIDVCLKPNKVYKIIASMSCGMIINYFYVDNKKIYYFMFPSIYADNRDTNNVTLLLTDYSYPNLPIERGEITLWQK